MLVPLDAFAVSMMVVEWMNERASLVALEKVMRIGAMDDRGQLWLGGLGILGMLMNVAPAMMAMVLGEEAKEEATA